MNPLDVPYGKQTTEYEIYLRTPELLSLQKEPAERTHGDEIFFQSVHQVEEIWMKCALHYLGEGLLELEADNAVTAAHHIRRAATIMERLPENLKLFDYMTPDAYIEIRKGLGRGSGMDSPGFQRNNEIAPRVWRVFEDFLENRKLELIDIYKDITLAPDVLAVAEALANYDGQMIRFKMEHLMTVRRIIGMGTSSLRGNPNEMLERSAKMTYFPMLWAVRDRLFEDYKHE